MSFTTHQCGKDGIKIEPNNGSLDYEYLCSGWIRSETAQPFAVPTLRARAYSRVNGENPVISNVFTLAIIPRGHKVCFTVFHNGNDASLQPSTSCTRNRPRSIHNRSSNIWSLGFSNKV